MSEFEELEKLNAQIDIWIDEEEFEAIRQALPLKAGAKTKGKGAFDHPNCASCGPQAEAWPLVLRPSLRGSVRQAAISQNQAIELGAGNRESPWNRLFTAKLMRAEIQAKGTDCYFRRLDDVVLYLERHLPGTDDEPSMKLQVLCLLELAACGEGPDVRSFAERARRALRHNKSRLGQFAAFYDLVARYSIGVSHFHESRYEQALSEFDYIIHQWETFPHPDYGKRREGGNLVYVPAVIYRAETQLKLQLAYHALKTLDRGDEIGKASGYRRAKADLIRAQAHQHMGELDTSLKSLDVVFRLLCPVQGANESRPDTELGWQETIQEFSSDRPNRSNLRVRLLELTATQLMLRARQRSDGGEDAGELLEFLAGPLLEAYRKAARYNEFERQGYIEQVAECLEFLSKAEDDRYQRHAENLWRLHSTVGSQGSSETQEDTVLLFAPDEQTDTGSACPCERRSLRLVRLDPEHYEEYCGHMLGFFQHCPGYEDSRGAFVRCLLDVERAGEEVKWRSLKYEHLLGIHDDRFGCELCLGHRPRQAASCDGAAQWGDNHGLRSRRRRKAFAGLLACCRDALARGSGDELSNQDYKHIVDQYDKHFLRHLRSGSIHAPETPGVHFLGLQRWNSSSPAQGRSVGGGYLLYSTGRGGRVELGIAVDPGFDFVRNLFHMGFSLSDIDLVLLSHAHMDHVRDFESIVMLLFELDKRDGQKKRGDQKRKIHAVMSLGVYRRLAYLIESPGLREFIETYIVDATKDIEIRSHGCGTEGRDSMPIDFVQEAGEAADGDRRRWKAVTRDQGAGNGLALSVTSIPSYHDDYSHCSDSFGFRVAVSDGSGGSCTFGYTGDTKWHPDIIGHYSPSGVPLDREAGACDSLLVHMGSLVGHGKDFWNYRAPEECLDLVKDKNHPYLFGLLHFLTEMAEGRGARQEEALGSEPLVLLGEFGEELRGGIRRDLWSRLKDAYRGQLRILPVDIGVDVLLHEWGENGSGAKKAGGPTGQTVRCVQCERFVELGRVSFEAYGHDEALFCVCKTCQKSASGDVLQGRLRSLYEEGYPLREDTRGSEGSG